jgi:2-polyprenyl-6-methoxyphenol hydroxylase-like FAD-dependent oxidoreductase
VDVSHRRVLISGASIAGPVAAFWLARAGFSPTIVERAPAPRPVGQAIDVRGAALDVLDRMDLLDAARAMQTRMKGFSLIDRDGRELWRTEEGTLSGGSFANDDIEVLRDDLAALLLGALPPSVEVIYGDHITSLDEDEDGVTVDFAHGEARRFALVIGADGVNSGVRDLVFGDERQFVHPLGFALAIYSAPNHIGLVDWQASTREGDAGCIVYTVHDNSEVRLCYSIPCGIEDEHRGDIPAQKALLAERAGGLGWEVPKLLEAMWDADDFWLGPIAQVRMPVWTRGRVALVGDAGYSPSPASGQGTSLAMVGGWVLAQELGRSPVDHAAAFARYEARMRPFVEKNQALIHVSAAAGPYGEGGENHFQAALDGAKNAIVLDV